MADFHSSFAADAAPLRTRTARDIMTPDVDTVREDAALDEAIALMATKGFGGLAVMNSADRPVGVLTSGDVVVHHHETCHAHVPAPAPGAPGPSVTRVGHVMTPAVFAVAPDISVAEVIQEILRMKVHRVFVVENDRLIGVITALDLLRQLPLVELLHANEPVATR